MTGTPSKVVESTALVDPAFSALNVGDVGDGEDFSEAGGFLPLEVEGAVGDGLLEIEGGLFATGGRVVITSRIVHANSPLSTTTGELLNFEFPVGETVALILVGEVNPVIEIPDETGRLVLHVAATLATFINFHFFVGHAVVVGVAVGPEVEGVGDADHDAVIERQNHTGEEHVVDEDRVLVVNAITISVLVTGNPGFGLLLAGSVGVLHVGEHFHNVERAISIPSHCNRLVDMRVAEGKFETIAVLEFDGFVGLLDGEESLLVYLVAGFGEEREGGEKWNKALHEYRTQLKRREMRKGRFFFVI